MESTTTTPPPRWPPTSLLLRRLPSPPPTITLLLVLLLPLLTEAAMINAPAKSDSFTPSDNYLLNSGSATSATLPGNRLFLSDSDSEKYLSYEGRTITVDSSQETLNAPSPIYASARIFESEATYTLHVTRPGWHWVRLHFSRIPNPDGRDPALSKFQVRTDTDLVLVHDFKNVLGNNATWALREYLVNVTTERFSIVFEPAQGSMAVVSGLEFVSAPDILLGDVATSVFPKVDNAGLSRVAYQTVYRLNVGGPVVTPENDTLGRTWDSDKAYLDPKVTGSDVSVKPDVITYPDGESPLIAPPIVYATATQMADAQVQVPSFNITWRMSIDTSFQYLVRLHFADIVSKTSNDLYFNVYINGKSGITALDLTTAAGGLSAAYYSDFVVNSSMFAQFDPLTVQVGPLHENAGTRNALLNGLEVLRMNNSVGSLDGEFGVGGKNPYGGDGGGGGPARGTVAAVGFAMMFGAFVGLGAMAVKWKRRPQDWSKQNSFSSWLLPIQAGDKSYLSSGKSSYGSRKSQFFSSSAGAGLGRFISLAELREATHNWDAGAVIGVGGFGNVYIGEIDGGTTRVAIKRGNPGSEQGVHEFQTEIQMLSRLRHRHLVSLVGYCDEGSEMILVYEYMSNGPLRDHLYGNKGLPRLTWKQRLETCIGAARGLHYLHTGAVRGIIHRDVKTTNILLDECLVAKMADFGLSKDGADGGQTHVSTAVKGSFGYLDPEYFRKQQLTDKSDVYSFGVVLLEALCARPPIDLAAPREQVNLAEWAMQWKRKGLLDKIIDHTLIGHVCPESMAKLAEAAEKCLAEYGVDRPTMGDVLWNLEHALQLQEAWLSRDGNKEEGDRGATEAVVRSESRAGPDEGPVGGSDVGPVGGLDVEAAAGVEEHSGTVMFAQFSALNGR